MSVCWRIPWKLVAILWGCRVKSPLKSIVHFQANPQPKWPNILWNSKLFRSFFQIRYYYTPSYMFTFCPHVSIGLCELVPLFFLFFFFLVGKAGLVSCLEFTFSISLMVVVAWKSIVLCAEPTEICSRHRGGGVFIFWGCSLRKEGFGILGVDSHIFMLFEGSSVLFGWWG